MEHHAWQTMGRWVHIYKDPLGISTTNSRYTWIYSWTHMAGQGDMLANHKRESSKGNKSLLKQCANTI
uniref:Uncharacterized protein n=1 Tax=Arundo donax TaxID=35708 RepID=A0A0A9ENI5_ARUDO